MIRSTPLKQTGKRSKREKPFYDRQKAAMYERDGWRCQMCHRTDHLTPEHVFGRAGTGGRLGAPWCHMADFLLCLCVYCHNAITAGDAPDAHRTHQTRAVGRFMLRLSDAGMSLLPEMAFGEPMGAYMRRLVEFAKESDFDPTTEAPDDTH